MSSATEHDNPREELREIAASLRAYLEWQVDCGSSGIPRLPRGSSPTRASAAASSSSSAFAQRVPQTAAAAAAAPTPSSVAAPSSLLKDPHPAPSLPDIPPLSKPPETAPQTTPSARARRLSESPPSVPVPPSVVEPRPLPVLASDVASCTQCGLHSTRTNTVFSRGSATARLCFVGEAPGADEDAQGLPFVGKAGQLLDKMIQAMGLDPEKDVYVCNIIKCRPPGNRRPEPIEVSTCIPYLHEQLAIVNPKVIVALGNTSIAALIGTKVGITKIRGSWKLYRGKIPVMPTYHPSYLLRQGPGQSEAKREVWEDLQIVMKELGLEKPAPSRS